MKKLITISSLMMAALSMQAQITIQQSDYSAWVPTTDTLQNFTLYSAVPSANATWNANTATYASSDFTIMHVALTNSNFPSASFSVPVTYSFSSYSYASNLALGISAQGIMRYGETINRQAISLAAATFNPQDSLVFDQQDIVYSAPRTLLAFPATYGNTWSSNYVFNTNFHITIGLASLNNAPGYRKSTQTITDTVAGWGKMRVKNAAGVTSGYMDVLAVRSHTSINDSFYLNGSPASATLLTTFGLTQGMITDDYKVEYFRAGEVEPLITEEYTDSTYSVLASSYAHQSRLKPAATQAIATVAAASQISVYPNPVVNGILHLDLGQNTQGLWQYEVADATGKKIASGQVNAANATIQLGAAQPGLYFMSVYNNGNIQATKSLFVK